MSEDPTFLRPQPHDLAAERALIGAMLLSAKAVADADRHITVADFYHPAHTAIATIIIARTSRNQPTEPTLLIPALAHNRAATSVDGGIGPYLHTCIHACPDPSHAPHYARIIAEHAAARRILALADDLAAIAYLDNPDRRSTELAAARTKLDRATRPLNGHHNIRLTPASTFTIKAVKWVWDGRMPLGELTLIPGREGVGKSTFLAWLAAAITNGNLPGIYHNQPRAVLYAASEDAWSYTIAPRMLAAGANLDLVYRIDVETDDGTIAGLILPRDCRHLPDIAAQVGAAALMCDPVLSLVDGAINTFKGQELRQALEPLRRAAEAAAIAVPALVHFNKSTSGDVGTMIAGARAWTEVARAVVAIAQDKDADDYTCVVSQTKNNLGRLDLPNLAYTIDTVTLEAEHDEPAHVGRLRWIGETDVSAEDLLTGDPADRSLSANTVAIIDFVDEAGEPVSVQDVAEHFKDRIKYDTVKKTLSRCAKRGDVVSLTRGMYKTAKTGKASRKGARTTPPYTPPVTTSHVSLTQFKGGIGVSPGDTGSVPGGVGTQRDTGTQGERAQAGARVREYTTEADESTPQQQQRPLISCRECHGPLDDEDGTGVHAKCEPLSDEPNEPEDIEEREWYR